jgi:acetyltransferase-like isoleucine patch superfamily enzyme
MANALLVYRFGRLKPRKPRSGLNDISLGVYRRFILYHLVNGRQPKMPSPIRQASAGLDEHEGFFSRVLTKLNSLWVGSTYPLAGRGRNLSLHYTSDIARRLAPHIRLGNSVEIGKHAWLSTGSEDDHEIQVAIGDGCRIGARCTISAKNSIHLERDVVLESDVLVLDNNHAYEDVSIPITLQGTTPGGAIRIEEGCRIGAGVVVLCDKGKLVLGRNCVVTPDTVVTRSFPPGSVLSGNPARIVHSAGKPDLLPVPRGTRTEDGEPDIGSPSKTGPTTRAGQENNGSRSEVKDSDRDQIRYLRQAMNEQNAVGWIARLAGKLRAVWLARTYPFASFGKGTWLHYSCRIARSAAPYISLGDNVGLSHDVQLDVSANPRTYRPALILETGSGMQRRGMILARNRIHVMKDVMFGFSVLVLDHGLGEEECDFSTQQKARGGTIRIEDECWIGFGAVIVCDEGELVIGRHSVIGANSVITRSIPPYSVVAGDPPRIVKQYDFAESRWVLGCICPAVGSISEEAGSRMNTKAQASRA